MDGLESTWALTSALMRLTGGEGGEGSWGLLGLDGRRPLRPFRLSVRTTRFRKKKFKINHSYTSNWWCVIWIMASVTGALPSCGWNINDPNELNAYLLSPFRQQGTSGSGRTGSGFFCVCQQDSFYLLNRRILRFSGRCAAKKKRTTVNAGPKISKQVVANILSWRYSA